MLCVVFDSGCARPARPPTLGAGNAPYSESTTGATTDSGCCDSFRPGAKLSLFRPLKRARSDSTAVNNNDHYERRERFQGG